MNFVDVSIIVPIYGIPVKYLETCINSLLNQTLGSYEIILIDDGNKDLSGEICDKYANLDGRIVVIHQENQGVSVARNVGIENAKAPYIIFVDPDDWVNSKMLEIVMNYVNKFEADLLIWDHLIETEQSEYDLIKNNIDRDNIEVIHIQSSGQIEELQRMMINLNIQSNRAMHGAPWGKLYKKDILMKNNIRFKPQLIRSQDREFNLRYLQYVKSVVQINVELYHYRVFADSAVNKYRPNSRGIMENYLIEIKKNLNQYKKPQIFYKDLDVAVIWKLTDICKTEYTHPSNKNTIKQKITAIREIINSEPYKSSIRKVNQTEFPRFLKLIIALAKRKQYLSIYLIYKLKNMLF